MMVLFSYRIKYTTAGELPITNGLWSTSDYYYNARAELKRAWPSHCQWKTAWIERTDGLRMSRILKR